MIIFNDDWIRIGVAISWINFPSIIRMWYSWIGDHLMFVVHLQFQRDVPTTNSTNCLLWINKFVVCLDTRTNISRFEKLSTSYENMQVLEQDQCCWSAISELQLRVQFIVMSDRWWFLKVLLFNAIILLNISAWSPILFRVMFAHGIRRGGHVILWQQKGSMAYRVDVVFYCTLMN